MPVFHIVQSLSFTVTEVAQHAISHACPFLEQLRSLCTGGYEFPVNCGSHGQDGVFNASTHLTPQMRPTILHDRSRCAAPNQLAGRLAGARGTEEWLLPFVSELKATSVYKGERLGD